MKNVGDFKIGSQTFIIAEIGSNHVGDIDLAFKSLEAAAGCGVDAVKFQAFKPDLLVNPEMPVLAHVPVKTHKTQRERFRQMALTFETFEKLAAYAKELGVRMLVTPFDNESADFIDRFVPAFKIASGDANNTSLLKHVIAKGKPMLVSTGMCTQAEVDQLVQLLPQNNSLLFHCIGSYPTPPEQANLSLIPFYRERYRLPIGYSDHTVGTVAAIAAVALGAVALEKHFILDKSLPAGDRELSLTPVEMKSFVKSIRETEAMLGKFPREVQPCEEYTRAALRRCAHAKRSIRAGERISINDIVWLRPAVDGAILFEHFDGSLVLKACKDIESEQPLTSANVSLLSTGEKEYV